MKTVRLYRPYRADDDVSGIHRVEDDFAQQIVDANHGHYVRKQMWKDFERDKTHA